MFTTAQLLCALLLPLALAVLLAAYSRRMRGAAGCLEPGLGGVQLALTVVVAHAATAVAVDARLIPPLMGWHWLPWAGLALLPAFAFAAPRTGGGHWRWAVQALVAAGGAVLLLRPMAHALGMGGIAAWAAAATTVVLITGWATAARPAGPLVEHLAVAIATGAVAIGAGLTGSKDLALLALIVPLAVIGSGLLHLRGAGPWAGGTLAAAHFLVWHLVINGTLSEMPWWCALLLALPLPAGALAARFSRTPRTSAALRLGITIAFALLALTLAATLAQPATSSGSEPDYTY